MQARQRPRLRPLPPPRDDRPTVVVLSVRLGLLLLVVVLAAVLDQLAALQQQLLLLALVAGLASIPLGSLRLRQARPVLEGAATAAIVLSAPIATDVLLPYLLVAPFTAGLLFGWVEALVTTGVTAVTLVIGRLLFGAVPTPAERTTIAQWIGLSLAVGLIGGWARTATRRSATQVDAYRAANRLLAQLREVTRSLPRGLDEVTLADDALQRLRDTAGLDRGALFIASESGVLVPLAFVGADRLDWAPSLEQAGPWARAWQLGRPQQADGRFEGAVLDPQARAHVAVIPLMVADRRVGLVGAEREEAAWGRAALDAAQAELAEAAVAIEAGQLFSDIRALATMEERRRLAREIHDGVAQEIAALGFAVDDLRARASDPDTAEELELLRGELSRVVQELRLSIFDLRSDLQPSAGLGAALTSYLRQVGTGSDLTVHLVLDESADRLGAAAETELLRIAQEAITNTRRHAEARNLWVTCRVTPPRAFLRVVDDGRGMGRPRADSFGMEIMRERAARIGAHLTCRSRVGGGTVIEVSLGSDARPPQRLRKVDAR